MSLKNASKETPKFSLRGLKVKAKCVKCYDGDTCWVVFPFNGELTRWTVRMYGVNTPEIGRCSDEEKVRGITARDFTRSYILDKEIWVKCYKFGMYGRLIADIYFNAEYEGKTMNDLIIEAGHSDCDYMRTEDKHIIDTCPSNKKE